MAVSGTYSGFKYDRTNARLDLYYRGTRVASFNSSGADFSQVGMTLPTNQRTGFIPLPITSLREVASDLIVNTATSAGGHLAADTTPTLTRINGATDKALCVTWATSNVDEVQFAPVALPADLDSTQPVIVHLRMGKSANTNTTTNVAVGYFEGVGDTNAGTSTAAMAVSTLATYTVTIAAADVGASPASLNITLIPAAHANDTIILYGAHLSYTKLTT